MNGRTEQCSAARCHFLAHAPRQTTPSLDHLVSSGEEPVRHGEAKRFGGCKIDDEIEFGGLLHRNVSGLGAAQNLIDEVGGVGPTCAASLGRRTSDLPLRRTRAHRASSADAQRAREC
jgi:hypothetical protein